jgi:aminobenzoyl-glutamate transport protein
MAGAQSGAGGGGGVSGGGGGRAARVLDAIEWLGNKLPEPAILFAILAGIVVVASAITSAAGWTVTPQQPTVQMVAKTNPDGTPVLNADGTPKKVMATDARGKPIVTLKPQTNPDGTPVVLRPRSLMTTEGVYWMLSSMVRNFTGLPALGLVFIAMLGIGLAEKFGLFSALMRSLAIATPAKFLTPVVVFVGANSSVASDAGYIILPPLAAALYLAVGRSPIAGLAAAFAGVAGGFGGGLFPTAADGFLAGVATQAAHIIDPSYPPVQATHNLYFKALSAGVVMIGGWLVTDLVIEPRLKRAQRQAGEGLDSADTSAIADMRLNASEKRGLVLALGVGALVLGVFAWMVLSKDGPLHGMGTPRLANNHVPTSTPAREVPLAQATEARPADVLFRQPPIKNDAGEVTVEGFAVVASGTSAMLERPSDRWSQVIVPVILLTFLLPGVAYGLATGQLRKQADFIDALYHGIRGIVPVLVISFFLGQFVNYFSYTGLDRMLAFAGGQLLVQADLPVPVLLVLFVLLVVAGDFAMSGMLSKFGVMAPIFIPMFMMVGMSPELTTAAYRIGDSVVNIITPLNSYLLIILAVLQKYKKNAGLGSLISLMLPYSVVLFVLWTGFLLVCWWLGVNLGPKAGLGYVPSSI